MPVALVTGASRGLGRVLAKALSKEGYSLALNYRTGKAEAHALLGEIGDRDALLQKADVSDAAEVRRMAAAIRERFGRLDVIINNAGVARDNLLLRQSEKEWDETIGTNLKGGFNIIRALSPLMARSGGGHIVMVSSYSGLKGKEGHAAYSASKAALLGLTRTAAAELAEHEIRVNAILPGYMETAMGMKAAGAMKKAKADSMLGRLSDPGEVAAFVLHLVTTRNITGQVFGLESRIL